MKFETIKTKRLTLRKLTPEAYKFIFENYSEPELRTFLGITSDEAFLKEKTKYEAGYTTYNRSVLLFQLIENDSQTVIGGCGFHNWYLDHKRAELGYALPNEDFKKKGIMSEALIAVIDYGFNKMGLHRIEALVGTGNTASLRLLEKNNFTKEGLLRQHYFVNNQYEDSLVFSLLKKDHKKHV
jgi:ribosomal-protein-alanine N-acetyltransferase